jgi:tyrosyl-tRNA synthetase
MTDGRKENVATVFPSVNEQMDIIRRGAEEIIPEEDLVRKLEKSIRTNTRLNVKLGCDPSRPDLHLGHSVVLRKLRHFQDLGHRAILIIGDFTGMIGDPSGRSKTRPSLSLEETRAFGESYYEQATRILSTDNIRMVYNSEWLNKMSFVDVITLASKYTVARMLERDDFLNRYRDRAPIGVHEFLYPLAQAMDSVAIESDIELGGTDQKFNLLVGRDIQREFGMEPQVILTLPLLTGTDGVEKMSKSLNNYIGITEPPGEIYGKTLSIADSLIFSYFELTTDVDAETLADIRDRLNDGRTNPRDLKRQLARTLVRMYHGEGSARQAEDEFDRIFIKKDVPRDIDEVSLDMDKDGIGIVDLMVKTAMVSSKSEARRLIRQGGVKIDNEKVSDANDRIQNRNPFVMQVGKRKFLKVVPKI